MKVEHIIIGAGRSGTTSLVAYLKQHAAINFSSIKEVTYFSVNDHYQRGPQYLHSFFDEKSGLTATSDTYLLMDKDAPQRMAEYNPNMKLTIILREPSARTYSNYHFSLNHGYIDKSISLIESEQLEATVLKGNDIVAKNNHANFEGSMYHKHITNWMKYFKREQLFICTTSQLKENPQELMNAYFDFLGLDAFQISELEAQHKAAGVKNKALNNFLVNRNHLLRKLVRLPLQVSFLRKMVLNSSAIDKVKESNRSEMKYALMSSEEKAFCTNYFKDDLEKLKAEFGVSF